MRRERAIYEVRLQSPSKEQRKLPVALRTSVLYKLEQDGATKRRVPIAQLDTETKEILMQQFFRLPPHARAITAQDLNGMEIEDLLENSKFVKKLRVAHLGDGQGL
jgi:hypothetical protein